MVKNRMAVQEFGRLIQSEAEYDDVVSEIDRLLEDLPRAGRDVKDRLEFLTVLVSDYDRKNYDLPGRELSPQQVVEFMLEMHELDRGDLSELMGGRSRVSEFFSGARELSLTQVQALRALFHIPADLLLGETPVAASKSKNAAIHVVPVRSNPRKFVVREGREFRTKPLDKASAATHAADIARRGGKSAAIHSSSGQVKSQNAKIAKDPKPPRGR